MDFVLDDLPPEVETLIRPLIKSASMPLLDVVSQFVSSRRDEAMAARISNGCESIWRYCEEAYVGIDEANRNEFDAMKWHKPMSMDGPITTGNSNAVSDRRCTVFVRLTSRYVDAGAAKLGEILLPPDDRAFSISEIQDPDLIVAKGDDRHVVHDELGVVLTRKLRKGEPHPEIDRSAMPGGQQPAPVAATPSQQPAAPVPPPGDGGGVVPSPQPGGGAPPQGGANVVPFPAQPGAAPQQPGTVAPPDTHVPLTVGDLAEEKIAIAREKAKRAETKIASWMSESNYISENRRVIKDAAKLGVGILKAPYPKIIKGVKVSTDDKTGEVRVDIEKRLIPGARAISPWDFFPDPACGECVHNGEYCFERDRITEKQIRELADLPGYLKDQILKVIIEGPTRASTSDKNQRGPHLDVKSGMQEDKYTIWYYYGTLKREEVEAVEAILGKDKIEGGVETLEDAVYVIATMVNSTVIKVAFNPLESGKFPYNAMPWQARAGAWFGTGVAEQVMSPQRMLNAGVRAMMDNAGVSAGSQIVIDQMSIYPADDDWTITNNKIWYKTGDNVETVEDAFRIYNIPNQTRQLIEMINFFGQLAEEASSIPLITQGQSGETSPETLGATQLQNNNANSLLRSIGYLYDDYVTEPVVYQYYEWYLLDPDVPDEDKAMFHIEAHGSVTLVDRAIQDQTIPMLKPFADDPKYGVDPKKFMKEMLKSKRIDPGALMMTPDQIKKQEETPTPKDPRIEAATIGADASLKVAMIKQQGDAATEKGAQAIAVAAQRLEQHGIDTNATVELHRIQSDTQLELLKYANQHKMTIIQAQVELAKTTATLQAQRDLNLMDHGVDLHKHHNPVPEPAQPIAQTPGRAENGKAFEQ